MIQLNRTDGEATILRVPREALWFEQRADGRIACSLCPNACVIAEGGHGSCRVRFNKAGTMELPFYGRVSSLAVDPIEKKPLYHFHPGSAILSVGFVGCSFRCQFCQNWHISQTTDVETRYVGPEELVSIAKRERSFALAYTYSEPLVHAEYILDAARLARESGLKNVIVSNGYVRPEPAEEILGVMDAANVDLKSSDPEFYHTETGGKLEEVKRFIAQAAGRIHLEVTTLVIPTKNDDDGQVDAIARFLASLDPSIPLHLSCYHPQYRYRIRPTPAATVERLARVARRHLRHVYVGNIGLAETNTLCSACGNLLVRRSGYSIHVEGLRGGRCARCEASSDIIGAP